MFWSLFAIFLAACFAAGSTGGLFPPGPWYRRLAKPSWTPPDWAFPVVWSCLYVCMAAAGARVAVSDGNALAMALWSLQIALNGLWTPVFFGLKRIKLGFVVLSVLWVSVAVTLVALWQVDWIAGALFAPYLGWVSIAAALNFSVWRLNPDEAAQEADRRANPQTGLTDRFQPASVMRWQCTPRLTQAGALPGHRNPASRSSRFGVRVRNPTVRAGGRAWRASA